MWAFWVSIEMHLKAKQMHGDVQIVFVCSKAELQNLMNKLLPLIYSFL